MIYTLAQLRDGTGFDPDARFLEVPKARAEGGMMIPLWRREVRALVDALPEILTLRDTEGLDLPAITGALEELRAQLDNTHA